MTLKLSFPHGIFSLVGEMPGNSFLFKDEIGRKMLLPGSKILEWLDNGVAKFIEPETDHWDDWGRPEIFITENGSGWLH
jgi:hypothetical protein